jgi:hypothetical protein
MASEMTAGPVAGVRREARGGGVRHPAGDYNSRAVACCFCDFQQSGDCSKHQQYSLATCIGINETAAGGVNNTLTRRNIFSVWSDDADAAVEGANSTGICSCASS